MDVCKLIVLGCLLATVGLADESKKYAILIGVNDYDHDKFDALPFAERDVTELHKLLVESGYEVKLLTGAAGAEQANYRPTLSNINRELSTLLGRAASQDSPEIRSQVNKRDLVLIALAGHGLQRDGEKDSFFCPIDAQPTVKSSLLSVAGLIRSLDESGAGAKLLLVDACRNDPNVARGNGLDGASIQALPIGVAALFSCSPGQRAFESKKAGGGHGIFFHFVLEGMRGAARNERGEVTWSRLSELVAERVESGVHEWIGPEHSQIPCEFKNFRGKPPVLRDNVPVTPDTAPPSIPTVKPDGGTYISQASELRFQYIPAGSFVMGAAEGEQGALAEESPRHMVRITKPFLMSTTEVSQAQYRTIMRTVNPNFANPSNFQRDDLPAENVSWIDAIVFCNALSAWDKKRPCYRITGTDAPIVTFLPDGDGYRLPTEAEWEYACRAKSSGPFSFSEPPTSSLINFDGTQPYVGEATQLRKTTVPVGSLPANDFGLHEMHGNVAEWCWDVFSPDYYGQRTSVVDPMGPPAAEWDSDRVIRGGWWEASGAQCRSASRHHYYPADRTGAFAGLRVVITAPGAIAQQTPTPATKASPKQSRTAIVSRTYLLRGTRGQVPDDPGTEMTTARQVKNSAGTFAQVDLRDSIGESRAAVVDWRTYSAVVVELVADRPAVMRFNVRHAGSSAYPTVIDEEFNVKQGKNVIRLPISSLKNTNGTEPRLDQVIRWYISLNGENAPPMKIFLGDVWLESNQ